MTTGIRGSDITCSWLSCRSHNSPSPALYNTLLCMDENAYVKMARIHVISMLYIYSVFLAYIEDAFLALWILYFDMC